MHIIERIIIESRACTTYGQSPKLEVVQSCTHNLSIEQSVLMSTWLRTFSIINFQRIHFSMVQCLERKCREIFLKHFDAFSCSTMLANQYGNCTFYFKSSITTGGMHTILSRLKVAVFLNDLVATLTLKYFMQSKIGYWSDCLGREAETWVWASWWIWNTSWIITQINDK